MLFMKKILFNEITILKIPIFVTLLSLTRSGRLPLQKNIYKYVSITYFMYFKIKTIKGKKYKYAVKTIRLPNS